MVKFDNKVQSSHYVTLLEVQYLQLWVVPCQTAYLVLMCPPLLLFHQVLFAENDEENSIYQLIIIDGRRNFTGWDAVNFVRILKLHNNYAQTWCIHSNRISVFHFSNDWKLDDVWYSLWLTKFTDYDISFCAQMITVWAFLSHCTCIYNSPRSSLYFFACSTNPQAQCVCIYKFAYENSYSGLVYHTHSCFGLM